MNEPLIIWLICLSMLTVVNLLSIRDRKIDIKNLWSSRDLLYKRLEIEVAQRAKDKKEFNKKLVKLEKRLRNKSASTSSV